MDEAFPHQRMFPRLSKKANVRHIVHDFIHRRQIDDKEIYDIAVFDNRFVVTINFKDFKKFVVKDRPGIIALPSDLTIKDIERVLLKFISTTTPNECMGKAIKLLG